MEIPFDDLELCAMHKRALATYNYISFSKFVKIERHKIKRNINGMLVKTN